MEVPVKANLRVAFVMGPELGAEGLKHIELTKLGRKNVPVDPTIAAEEPRLLDAEAVRLVLGKVALEDGLVGAHLSSSLHAAATVSRGCLAPQSRAVIRCGASVLRTLGRLVFVPR